MPKLTVPKKIILSAENYSYDLLKGVKATSYDGKIITNEIEIEENIDFETPGKYTITYKITDETEQTASANTIAVVE